jgi:hypothetical protein
MSQQITASFVITRSNLKLLELAEEVFSATDFSKVEEEIAKASKVRLGLKALSTIPDDFEDYENYAAFPYQTIIQTLNKLCNVY